jgi:hypothetical protein
LIGGVITFFLIGYGILAFLIITVAQEPDPKDYAALKIYYDAWFMIILMCIFVTPFCTWIMIFMISDLRKGNYNEWHVK